MQGTEKDRGMPDPGKSGSKRGSGVKIELLKIADCPNAEAARKVLTETLEDLGRAEHIEEIEVADSAQAAALRFPGSPTIRIDNLDVETVGLQPDDFALSCRMYAI